MNQTSNELHPLEIACRIMTVFKSLKDAEWSSAKVPNLGYMSNPAIQGSAEMRYEAIEVLRAIRDGTQPRVAIEIAKFAWETWHRESQLPAPIVPNLKELSTKFKELAKDWVFN